MPLDHDLEKNIGAYYSVKLCANTKRVEIIKKDKVVGMRIFKKYCDAVNLFARLKKVADVKELL